MLLMPAHEALNEDFRQSFWNEIISSENRDWNESLGELTNGQSSTIPTVGMDDCAAIRTAAAAAQPPPIRPLNRRFSKFSPDTQRVNRLRRSEVRTALAWANVAGGGSQS